ncbi:DUF1624 domain-containing protein [Pseudomonas sp. S75]|uniref:DUF1624 domain-containing protein n=1 Tax=unclassified Pseudomonas TaxID=196821 RepID=UPI0019034AA1|nr:MULTISPECIES: DUF1624 domain-containing protein [unclassified Pseudomonas]MBJ9973978.1 DUF1624 domain-containing protein [Pseudomonas sp. S30]MBK0152092.1 DUF1624 domain-containing protein [Pseudomonas sp. S75]
MSTVSSAPPVRLHSIDALRGLVMLFMLLDHVRETFLLHRQVGDPMDVGATEPALFVSRTLAHLCAPVFVLLTGLSAWLYGEKHQGPGAVSAFLFKRGVFLIVLELTLVNLAWSLQLPPSVVYLQVIWAIGLSMLALSLLIWLPRPLLLAVALAIIAGHNALDGLHVAIDSPWHPLWAILHERSWLPVSADLRVRVTYPLLPWIGVIALGYGLGPWFARGSQAPVRARRLLLAGAGALLGFAVLRAVNGYGEAAWAVHGDVSRTLMSLFNITKYPPSLAFLLLTLGVGLLLLRRFEGAGQARWIGQLAVLGSAPMFFYLLHLYVLKALYLVCVAIFGRNHGEYFGFDGVAPVWLLTALLTVTLYAPVRRFASFKRSRRDIAWLKYL